jgi:hypothetical protein
MVSIAAGSKYTPRSLAWLDQPVLEPSGLTLAEVVLELLQATDNADFFLGEAAGIDSGLP